MFYLMKNKKIIDSNIVNREQVWSCNQLVKKIFNIENDLYFETASGSKILAGAIVKSSDDRLNLIEEGLQIEYNSQWYTIRHLEGLEGLFIGVPSKMSNGDYKVVYKDVKAIKYTNLRGE